MSFKTLILQTADNLTVVFSLTCINIVSPFKINSKFKPKVHI
ncbi:hypothetical protein [Campylobacter phage CJLB-12]|nr:hypothetical protein [Campylobacter phage CJLB-12]